VVRGFSDDFYVIHFDAHIDYAPFIHGVEMSNSQAFRHIHALPKFKGLWQVGIRGLRNVEAWIQDSINDGNRVVTMEEYYDLGDANLFATIPANSNVYVSIDIDVLDMSLVPGTVSGEPNGMKYHELRDTLTVIAEHFNVVGFDLVEVNPQLDVGTGATSYLAAHTVLEFLGRICDQPRWKERKHR
jgi:agmatinase